MDVLCCFAWRLRPPVDCAPLPPSVLNMRHRKWTIEYRHLLTRKYYSDDTCMIPPVGSSSVLPVCLPCLRVKAGGPVVLCCTCTHAHMHLYGCTCADAPQSAEGVGVLCVARRGHPKGLTLPKWRHVLRCPLCRNVLHVTFSFSHTHTLTHSHTHTLTLTRMHAHPHTHTRNARTNTTHAASARVTMRLPPRSTATWRVRWPCWCVCTRPARRS